MQSLSPISSPPVLKARLEYEILILCASAYWDKNPSKQLLSLLQKEIDWDYLLQTAINHRIMPILYWHLSLTCVDRIPKPILAKLQETFCVNVLHNLVLTSKLLKTLDLLSAHNIQALPFKGSVLALMAYQNIALRQFSDLDIIVPEQHVSKVKHLLMDLGYQVPQPICQDIQWHGGEYPLIHETEGSIIDLHWTVAPKFFPFSINLENWWQNQSTLSLFDKSVPTFSPEDTLLLLCIHAATNLWIKIGWICDVAALMVHYELNWQRIILQAQEVGCERILLIHLFLVKTVLKRSLPDVIERKLEDNSQIKFFASLIYQWLFASPEESKPFDRVEGFILYIRMRERFWHKIQHLLYLMQRSNWLIPSGRDQAYLPLPPAFHFLYYVIRPIRLIQKYGPALRHLWN